MHYTHKRTEVVLGTKGPNKLSSQKQMKEIAALEATRYYECIN
jgi:hypothetical protein